MTSVVAQMAQMGKTTKRRCVSSRKILHTPNKESAMVKTCTLLSISLGQLAEDLVLVGNQLCKCLVGLLFVRLMFFVFLLRCGLCVLRLWYFVVVVRCLGGRCGCWRLR